MAITHASLRTCVQPFVPGTLPDNGDIYTSTTALLFLSQIGTLGTGAVREVDTNMGNLILLSN